MKKLPVLLASTLLCAQAWSQNSIPSIQPEKTVLNQNGKPVSYPSPKSITAVWGTGASVGVADGEFQNAIITSTTGYPYDQTQWTANSINQSGGMVTPGSAFWARTTTGTSQGAYASGIPAIASPTQSNGSAIFDSDFLDNAGIAGNFGGGTSPSAHRGELVSPIIDLTGYTDSVMAVRFFCKWRNFQASHLVSLSTDGGNTWTDVVSSDLLPASANAIEEGWITAIFPTATMGVSNLSQCRIRFVFDGDYYFEIVDDVSVGQAEAHDLFVATAVPNGTSIDESYNQYQITNNAYYPESQLSTFNFIYGGNVKNGGYLDVLPADSARFTVTIEQDNGGTWTSVHTETVAIDTIVAGAPGTVIIDTLDNNSWAQVGNYRAKYTVYISDDSNTDNDSVFQYFSITANDYASKVPLDTAQLPASDYAAFPGGIGSMEIFEFGSMFSFPAAGTEGLTIDSMTYRYFVPSDYVGNDEVHVRLNVYEWTDGSGTGTVNGYTDTESELQLVASSIDTISGLLNNLNSYGASTGSIVDINLNPSFEMQDSKFYYVSIALENTLNGVASLQNDEMIWIGTYNSKNYALNLGQTTGADPVSSPCLLLLTESGTTEAYFPGFGLDKIPSLGLHISQACAQATAAFDTTTNYLAVTFADATAATQTGGAITSWSWDFGDGNTSTMQNPSHVYADSGTYIVCLTVYDNCGSSTTCDTVTVHKNITGLTENWMDLIQVYPIPASDVLTIDGMRFEGDYTVEIVDLAGQTIQTSYFYGEASVSLDLSAQRSGSYFVRIGNAEAHGTKSILILK